jgi:hypothetical protein
MVDNTPREQTANRVRESGAGDNLLRYLAEARLAVEVVEARVRQSKRLESALIGFVNSPAGFAVTASFHPK